MAKTGQLAAWVGRDKGFEIREYQKILSHTFPLEKINEASRQQEDVHITRGAIAPN